MRGPVRSSVDFRVSLKQRPHNLIYSQMKFLISTIFFLIFFLGSNVLNTLGIDSYYFFYAILTLCAMTLFLLITQGKYQHEKRKWEHLIIILIMGMLLYRMMSGMLLDSIRNAAILLATPFIYLLIPTEVTTRNDYLVKKRIMSILLAFYLTECSIAIFEYIFKIRVFLWVDTTFNTHLFNLQQGESFRSVALHGAPLTNALIITILNAFLITAPIKNKYKLLLWGLGTLATLAFNARMAAIVNVALLITYLLSLLTSKSFSLVNKLQIYFLCSIFAGFIIYLAISYGWGDRLFKTELLDKGSGQVRLDVFSAFDYVDIVQLLKGHSMKDFEAIQDRAGLLIIENFWVCEVLLYGLLFLILLVFLYWKLISTYTGLHKKKTALIVCISFVLLASTNNSLFTQYLPFLLFLTCLNIFRPDVAHILLPRKMVEPRELNK